ncbi:hypothetical protein [Micromonospora sp. NBC_00617]|uniref:hypothetical protein n=1 Tax=Micromonospora sp. NBC_00617 TaxID=2903587 RepID=UPI0030E0B55F
MTLPNQRIEQVIEESSHADAPTLAAMPDETVADSPSATEKVPAAKKASAKPRATSNGRAATRTPSTKKTAAKKTAGKKTSSARKTPTPNTPPPKYPRHDVRRALRIPQAILDQNAGHPSTPNETAAFLGVGYSGEFGVEISSAKKYGFLESQGGKLAVTDRAKQALRPRSDTDEENALREAVFNAPEISDVYAHYRGEYLPDERFLKNALVEQFGIPANKVSEFLDIFSASLQAVGLIIKDNDRIKIVDVGREDAVRVSSKSATTRRTPPREVLETGDTCFVMQPFSGHHGGYYEMLFKPAIEKSGLRPVRADENIFGSGKIMDQVWRGIRAARVLVAELTTRNPNVFYELGLAHALGKPVVLVSSGLDETPFDLHHIRVIYYDINDPFWGTKLIDKIAENIRSAIDNPEEAIFTVED